MFDPKRPAATGRFGRWKLPRAPEFSFAGTASVGGRIGATATVKPGVYPRLLAELTFQRQSLIGVNWDTAGLIVEHIAHL